MARADLGKADVSEILNRVLRSFTLDQLDMLAPIEPAGFEPNNVIYCQDEVVSHLIFINRGLYSLARCIDDGHRPVIIWAYGGPYGVLGTHTLLQRSESLYEYKALTKLRGWKVRRDVMHAAMSRDVGFSKKLQAIARISHAAIGQIAACRAVHTFERRFCRQLVMFQQAMESNYIPVSRRMLTEIVPMSRGYSFRLVASLRGIVTFQQESLVINDLEAVERRACGCFRQIVAERRGEIKDW
jgi:hypothetical protein